MSFVLNIKIETEAMKVLNAKKIVAPPVSAESIADFHCDLNLDWINFGDKAVMSKILAAIKFDDKKIYMNELYRAEFDNTPGRRNFTIAHELGHWILHKHLAQEKLPGVDDNFFLCRGINGTINNPERQANFFASCLLMPRTFIEETLKDFKSPLNEYDIKELSDEFCVSKQAMMIRLVDELHLLSGTDGIYYRRKEDFLEAGGQLRLF